MTVERAFGCTIIYITLLSFGLIRGHTDLLTNTPVIWWPAETRLPPSDVIFGTKEGLDMVGLDWFLLGLEISWVGKGNH